MAKPVDAKAIGDLGLSHSPVVLSQIARDITWALRHGAPSIGLAMNPDGFVLLMDLIQNPHFGKHALTLPDIRWIVAQDKKGRFTLKEDDEHRFWIRANQGHSIALVKSEELLTPITDASLYPVCVHGTTLDSWQFIQQQGLKRMSRNNIHFASSMTPSDSTHLVSGFRADCQVLVHLDLDKCLKDNIPFFVSDNKVILSEGIPPEGTIPPKYFARVQMRASRARNAPWVDVPFDAAAAPAPAAAAVGVSIVPAIAAAPPVVPLPVPAPDAAVIAPYFKPGRRAAPAPAAAGSGIPGLPADAAPAAPVERKGKGQKRRQQQQKVAEPAAAAAAEEKNAPPPAPVPAAVPAPAAAAAAAGKETFAAIPADGPAYLAVLDFEATCDEDRSFGPQEIIEFPVVMLNTKTLETECVFHSYVRPERNPALTRFCTNLTGIEQKEVDLAPVFLQVLAQLKQFLFDHHFLGEQCEGRSFLFSTCGDWDLKTMLPLQCGVVHTAVPAWMSRWANVKKIYNEVTHNPPRIRVDMVEMLHGLHLPLLGRHHNGLDDATNIAAICAELIRRGGGSKTFHPTRL